MKHFTLITLLSSLGLIGFGCSFSPSLPDPLVPVGAHPVALISATGHQIYECRSAPGQRAQWAFVAPEAELFDRAGRRIGRHYAGPHWEADDGSRIVGRVKARSDAPVEGAIPWLLLEAQSVGAPGAFANIRHVQRVNTTGGVAPRDGCDAARIGHKARVPYQADYILLEQASAA